MPAVYIDRRNTRLRYATGILIVEAGDGRCQRVPLAQIDFLVLRSNLVVDTTLLASLADQGSGVLLMAGRSGRRTAFIHGYRHGRAQRRLALYQATMDDALRRRLARWLVALKMLGQWRLLRRALQQRPDQRRPLIRAQRALRAAVHGLRRQLPDTARLRGIEGAAAAAFFSGYSALLPPNTQFTGRNRRPPRDPVNAALSLGYTLLHADQCRALQLAGLDPLLGLYHDVEHGRESLACDLAEPFRCGVEQLVWRLFAERTLQHDGFEQHNGACLMKKAARGHFYSAYEGWASTQRGSFLRSAQRLGQLLETAAGGTPTARRATHPETEGLPDAYLDGFAP